MKIGYSDDVIDIACGPGHITNWLSKVTGGKVTGIDISEGMVKQAKALYPEIEFRKIAVEDLDYNDDIKKERETGSCLPRDIQLTMKALNSPEFFNM